VIQMVHERSLQSPAPNRAEPRVALDTMMKFSELDRELAARTYDRIIGTFTTNGVVDLDIAPEVLKVTKQIPSERVCDFRFAKKADSELTQARWKP